MAPERTCSWQMVLNSAALRKSSAFPMRTTTVSCVWGSIVKLINDSARYLGCSTRSRRVVSTGNERTIVSILIPEPALKFVFRHLRRVERQITVYHVYIVTSL